MRERDEEVVNAWTHLIGAIGCLAVLIFVLLSSSISLLHKLSFLPMIITSMGTFLSSFIYHISDDPVKKERNRKLDKSSIYVMILGCGITTCLTCSDRILALVFSAGLIIISAIMVISYCLSKEFPDWFSVTSYVILGWLAVFPSMGIFSESLYSSLGLVGYLLLSGVLYCTGVIFYTRDSKKWNHTIWHLFVMAGSGTHISIQVISITS